MSRIKIKDLPKNFKISEKEFERVRGGILGIGYVRSLPQSYYGYDIGPTGRYGYDIGPTGRSDYDIGPTG